MWVGPTLARFQNDSSGWICDDGYVGRTHATFPGRRLPIHHRHHTVPNHSSCPAVRKITGSCVGDPGYSALRTDRKRNNHHPPLVRKPEAPTGGSEMNSQSGNSLLELIISIALLMVFFGATFPLWGTLFNRLSTIRSEIRQGTHLEWIADRLCDDIQFGGTPSVFGSKLTISGSPTIVYQSVSSTLRRTSGQSTQTLSVFPVTQWTATPVNGGIRFHIGMALASINRTCVPW